MTGEDGTLADTSLSPSVSSSLGRRRRLRRVQGSRELRSHCSRPTLSLSRSTSATTTDAGNSLPHSESQSLTQPQSQGQAAARTPAPLVQPLPKLASSLNPSDVPPFNGQKKAPVPTQRPSAGHKRGLSALSLTPSETPSAQWRRGKVRPLARTSDMLALGHMSRNFARPYDLGLGTSAGAGAGAGVGTGLGHETISSDAGVAGGPMPLTVPVVPVGPAAGRGGRRWTRWPNQRLRFRLRGRRRAGAAAVAALRRAGQAAKVAVKAPRYAHTLLRACLGFAWRPQPGGRNTAVTIGPSARVHPPRAGARPASIPGAWPAAPLDSTVIAAV